MNATGLQMGALTRTQHKTCRGPGPSLPSPLFLAAHPFSHERSFGVGTWSVQGLRVLAPGIDGYSVVCRTRRYWLDVDDDFFPLEFHAQQGVLNMAAAL
jgi:hypothetical protein